MPPQVHAQASAPALAHSPSPTLKLLDCAVAPGNATCDIALLTGQDSVQFSVAINPAVLHPAKDSVPVTIAASRCCVHAQTVVPDANGFVSVMWRAAQKPDTNVHIRFMMRARNGDLLRDSVRLVKPATSPPMPVQTHPYHQIAPRYVWVRGDHIPVAIPIEILTVGTEKPATGAHAGQTLPSPATRERCEKVRAVFVALQGGTASPDTVRAMWNPDRAGAGWHATEGRCLVATHWKLADDAGEQVLDVTIGGDSGVARSRMLVNAYARQPPRLSGGYGYFSALRQDRDRTCAQAVGNPRCAGQPDSTKITVQVRSGASAAYFGVEFPIFISKDVSDQSWVGKYISQHLRLVFGSTFERPADNIFVGVTILPLLWGATEAAPFQVSAGMGRHGWDTRYIGISLDASTIISPVLAAIGVGTK